MTRPNPPPVVRAIEARRDLLGITIAEAARRAGIGPDQWRLYTRGWRETRGQITPTRYKTDTIAWMAFAAQMKPTEITGGRLEEEVAARLEVLRGQGLAAVSDSTLVDELRQRLEGRTSSTTSGMSMAQSAVLALLMDAPDTTTVGDVKTNARVITGDSDDPLLQPKPRRRQDQSTLRLAARSGEPRPGPKQPGEESQDDGGFDPA